MTRLTYKVGREGRLGGQAHMEDTGGTWKQLMNNVNIIVSNLTAQVRDITDVNKVIARGDLSKRVSIKARGERYWI
jgi:hypothetical protein